MYYLIWIFGFIVFSLLMSFIILIERFFPQIMKSKYSTYKNNNVTHSLAGRLVVPVIPEKAAVPIGTRFRLTFR